MGDVASVIAPQALRRLLKDIQRAQEPLMQQQGIWYHMDEAMMTKGLALIKGPTDTPYEGCLLVFSFQFPSDYPFSPPKVQFLTTDGKTRFHPNLYVDGKVCLSILGTYTGPSWSGTQSLSSILLSILALLDANPLAHEPAFTNGTLMDSRHRDYADVVEHEMVKLMVTMIEQFETNINHHLWEPFEEIVQEQLPSLKETLGKKIWCRQEQPERLWGNAMYGMSTRSFWKRFTRDVAWLRKAV